MWINVIQWVEVVLFGQTTFFCLSLGWEKVGSKSHTHLDATIVG